MDPANTPVLCKILAYINEKTWDILLNKMHPKLEETRPFQPALVEPNPSRAPWTGFFEASLGEQLKPDGAAIQADEKGFTKLSRHIFSEVMSKRFLFLNLSLQ